MTKIGTMRTRTLAYNLKTEVIVETLYKDLVIHINN